MLGRTEGVSTDSAVVGIAVHVGDQVIFQLGRTGEIKDARRAGSTFIPRVIVHVDQKIIGLTEVLSIDSAVVGLAVHVLDKVHYYLGQTN